MFQSSCSMGQIWKRERGEGEETMEEEESFSCDENGFLLFLEDGVKNVGNKE